MPPSPSEIESFGANLDDTSSLRDADSSDAIEPTDVADQYIGSPDGEEAESSETTSSDEGSLLMRYLRSNG